jgi:putative tryptophan/tyrosine transport system substrate-binding protein
MHFDQLKRRDFITLLGGAAVAWPLAARAQQPEGGRHIGVLLSGSEDDQETQARLSGLRQGLGRLGWSEGRNIKIGYRYASGSAEQARSFAKELVALKPEVIVTVSTPVALALQRETDVIPVVFVGVVDPVGARLVASLARPGGNLTGTVLNEPTVVGKWLAMLKEYAPNLARVAVLFNSESGSYQSYYKETAEAAARALTIELVPNPISSAADIDGTITALAVTPNSGLLVPPDITAALHRDLIIALAARHRLPAVYQARFWVESGGLMSYGPDIIAMHRQAAYYVDRILRGTAPTDLPVQAPSKYETTLNLKTAKLLGFEVPPGLLVAADEVIELQRNLLHPLTAAFGTLATSQDRGWTSAFSGRPVMQRTSPQRPILTPSGLRERSRDLPDRAMETCYHPSIA